MHRATRRLGLTTESPTLHMSFTGNPGTGKTSVALRMADILQRMGYARKGQLVTVTRDDLVIVVAGYTERMEWFFQSNPGFRSRIAHHVEFPDYTAEELLAIAKLTVELQNYRLSESAEVAFKRYIDRRMRQPHFANGRSVRNALDRARLRQANRHFMDHDVTREQLMTIEDVDILASRVFVEPMPRAATRRMV